MNKLEWGPRPICEVFLALNEAGEIFYQFTGLNGGPADPNMVHRLLQITNEAIVKSYQAPEVQVSNVTTLEREP